MRNKELHRQAMHRYITSEKGRHTRRIYCRKTRQEYRNKVIKLLGERCVKCGFNDIRILQIDHINGCGTKERKAMSSLTYYKKILEEIQQGSKKYQILCPNCNWLKRIEKMEYF